VRHKLIQSGNSSKTSPVSIYFWLITRDNLWPLFSLPYVKTFGQ
jgi:hypothetical protein